MNPKCGLRVECVENRHDNTALLACSAVSHGRLLKVEEIISLTSCAACARYDYDCYIEKE